MERIWTIKELLTTVVIPTPINTEEGDYLIFRYIENHSLACTEPNVPDNQ